MPELPELPERYPDILAGLARLAYARATRYLDERQASALALEIAEEIRCTQGGSQSYIPQGRDLERRVRNDAIWREFNGHNYAALARRHGLSVAMIYSILSSERKARQPDLF